MHMQNCIPRNCDLAKLNMVSMVSGCFGCSSSAAEAAKYLFNIYASSNFPTLKIFENCKVITKRKDLHQTLVPTPLSCHYAHATVTGNVLPLVPLTMHCYAGEACAQSHEGHNERLPLDEANVAGGQVLTE